MALLVGSICVVRAPAIFAAHFIDDENIYAVVGTEIAHGGLPYVSAIERKPPLLLYTYAGVLRVFGAYDWFALHLVATLWALATMYGLYLCARALWDARAGLWAALLYGVYLGFGLFRNLAWNGEMLMNLPLAYALWLALAPSRGRYRPELFVASLLIGVATLLKQPAAIALPALGAYVLWPSYRGSRRLGARHVLVQLLWLGLGFACVLAAAGLALRALGILREAWFWSVGHHDPPQPLDPVFWRRALAGSALFGVSCLPLLAAAWLGLRRRPERDFFRGRDAEHAALWLLLGASLLGSAAGGRFYPHYFIQLLPPLALAAAPYAAWVVQERDHSPAGRTRFVWAYRGFVANVLVVWAIQSWVAYQERGTTELVRYLRERAAPDTRMFVWGQAPELYAETRVRPASRYVATFPLTGYVFGSPLGQDPSYDTSDRIVPGSWDNLSRDLRAHPPRFILDADGARAVPRYPIRNYPLLRSLLDDYRLVLRGSQALLYERKQP